MKAGCAALIIPCCPPLRQGPAGCCQVSSARHMHGRCCAFTQACSCKSCKTRVAQQNPKVAGSKDGQDP
eukprot:1107474-Pelagomonas_calceolata.AAC.2